MFGIRAAQPLSGILTYDLNFICGIDFPRPVGDPAGVSAALFWRKVPQTQSPLLLTALADLLLGQEPVVLQPHYFRPRISTGHAFESHRAADGTCYHPFSHLGRLGEAGTNFSGKKMKHLVTNYPCFYRNQTSVLTRFSSLSKN